MDISLLWQTLSHNPIATFAAGLALANAKSILHYIVLAVFKVPFIRAWLVGHPQEALAALDAFRDEVKADIEALNVKAEVAATPPPAA